MIKKFLLGLGLVFLGFINFSNAGSIQTIGLDPSNSIYDGNYKLTFLKGGGVLTNYFGQSKSVLSFVQSGLFRWYVDGKPYFYDNGFQGYFGEYRFCDELTGNNSIPTNCISHPITGDFKGTFKGFFSNVSAGDYAYYDYEPMDVGSSYYDNTVQVCWSSRSYHASLCFRQHSCYNGRGCSAGNYGSLVGSKGLTLSFDLIQQARIGYAPGQAGYDGSSNIDGGSQNVNNPSITGNVTYSTCTKQKALDYYRVQGYKDKLCYSSYGNNNDVYIGPSSVSNYSLTGTDIIDVWFDTWHLRRYGNTGSDLSYSDWFQYWRKSFEIYNSSYNSSGTVSNPFLGVPVSLFTLFGNIYSYGLAFNNESILEYCNLVLLDQDLHTPYTGLLGTFPCNYSAIDILADTLGVHAESGDVVQGSSWEGILNRPGYHLDLGRNSGSIASGSTTGLSYFGDGKSFINNSFNTLSNSFRFPDRVSVGIIPNYILVFMFALILFRFISH